MLSNSQIQVALNKAGVGPIAVDGVIGPQSKEAIKRYQRLNKLMPDGIVGPKTNAALEKVYDTIQPVVKTPVANADYINVFSERGMKMLDNSEDIRTAAYWDTAKPPVLTIGLGMTMGSKLFREWWEENRPNEPFTIKSRMTMAEIMPLARQMINLEYGKAVNDALGGVKVPQPQFDAAVHFVWNTGVGAVRWKWFAPFKRGDYKEAARLIRTNYHSKNPELKGRREKEADLMEHGVYH